MSVPTATPAARSESRSLVQDPGPREYLNLIGGSWTRSRSGKSFENRNPARPRDLLGTFPDSGPEDVDAAAQAAARAFAAWRLVPAPRRAEALYRAAELLRERKEDLARLMTREMGKVIAETRGDVQEAIDMAYYIAAEGRRLFGVTVPSELPNKIAMSMRQPLGVCGLITPWNFPMAIPSWKIFPALVSGNTVVIKPASDTPASAHHLVEILVEAGVPEGVVNIVHGGGSSVGIPLVVHPQVKMISFTGSSDVGKTIAERSAKTLKRVSLELGGKNAQIVMEDADLDLAVEGALWGAFGTTGQRCTATSRLIVMKSVHDDLVRRLVERASKLVLGDGLDPRIDVGPLVNRAQRDRVHSYVEIGKKEGAKLILGGSAAEEGALGEGSFYRPTIFDGVTPAMRIAVEEIFGPVLSVITVSSLDEAIEVLNGTPYGLSSSIYTRDVNRAMRAVRDIEAGISYVNGPTIGAEVQLPFGGVKETGNGHREGGPTVIDAFTEWKSVYVDYSGRLQKAQIDR
ncbi:MAG: aldehyde dehydrogenase family protein [Candidatus Latescibacteria bacterium]|nr:aldehyde dehydrogenase family protein [Candidatus Latescibacterota bacterium]